jgi:hypothetical protein
MCIITLFYLVEEDPISRDIMMFTSLIGKQKNGNYSQLKAREFSGKEHITVHNYYIRIYSFLEDKELLI